jgi:deazaflavin-dependent oxidoreductase (nitroreductase family)
MSSPPAFPPPGSLRAKLMNVLTGANVVLYRLSGGRLGGKMDNLPVLLLQNKGRKSGAVRTAPLLYLEDGQDLVIVASRGGSDETPAWWLNLQANPRTTVEIKGKRHEVVARLASDEERARLWPLLVAGYRHYAAYQERTQRQIPVIILSAA